MAQLVKPFYAPISAGSMAHTGAIPQNHVSYMTITSDPNRTTPIVQPLQPIARVGQGHLPVSLTPIVPPSTNRPSVPGAVHQPNIFNHPNI